MRAQIGWRPGLPAGALPGVPLPAGAGSDPEVPVIPASETVTVAGTDAGARGAADAFETFGAAHGVPAEVRWRFLVALDEALSNIVRHGYRERPGEIELTFAIEDDVLRVCVSDAAEAFNPLLVPAPDTTAPLDDRRQGGLGIALVRALMDEVRYERRDPRNHLVLTRRLQR